MYRFGTAILPMKLATGTPVPQTFFPISRQYLLKVQRQKGQTDALVQRVMSKQHTVNVEHDVVRFVVILGADLTLVDTLVHWSYVLYTKTPFVHSLVVVDADSCIWCEWKQTYCQRMHLVVTLPRHLHTVVGSSSQTLNRKIKNINSGVNSNRH